jgi:hypothetical protein
MESGEWYPRAPWVRHTHAPGCSSWPTPTAWLGRSLDNAWCGPRTYEQQDGLPKALTEAGEVGWLNPEWVEWLMGFPIGWTDLEDSVMPLFPLSPNGSAG